VSGLVSAHLVACPVCGTVAAFSPANDWRPFCSERCRTLDLGAWASESYRIPEKPGPQDPATDVPDDEAGR